ncbi:MAG TPA: DinB family protein [Chloroflexi bacterium]|nr:DinB family protein [Chloroflexota bacterium]
MNIEQIMATMQMNVRRIAALVAGVGATQARWKPDAASWSILEVVNHLLDEEREDFRVRIDFTLHRPGAAWPPIDPGGWVTARRYNERDLAESLTALLAEREQSLAWLRGLPTPDWSVTAVAPWGEPFPAGKLLAAWVAHDLLHLRQLVELHWAWTTAELAPFTCEYAGEW